jgi:hypothetical protein
MATDVAIQHSNWVITFLTAVAIPLAFCGATLLMLWLDARGKKAN